MEEQHYCAQKNPKHKEKGKEGCRGEGQGLGGRTWGGRGAKPGARVCEMEGGRDRNGRQVAGSLELLRTRQVQPRERLFLSSFE